MYFYASPSIYASAFEYILLPSDFDWYIFEEEPFKETKWFMDSEEVKAY